MGSDSQRDGGATAKGAKEAPSREGVAQLFDRIAPTYDLLNRLLSFRRDVAWRRRLVDRIPRNRPVRLLDLATGTADVLITAHRRVPTLTGAVGIDMSEQMLVHGREKLTRLGLDGAIELQQGDATALDLADGSFDVATIAFGIRNVMDTPAALGEMLRILKPGGRALILEFSLPRNRVVRAIYLCFFRHILPGLGGLVSGDPKAYTYLNQTVETYPYGPAFIRILDEVGFTECSCTPLTFGIASLYSGHKPL
ncbi:MAG: bifunctional demethylmenaquinone methyltransferase/2-methoxy-6-polyprenyl-1,4-benzoquinol methylase UbiE [Lentisphaerae bacterium]|nr:bifunctional demethylmenaquinone methyltransferase/2-methoxy-6-polyprenyl-1,4-benzoquinol methylase UbiE [Lentisphaerota bacterium]